MRSPSPALGVHAEDILCPRALVDGSPRPGLNSSAGSRINRTRSRRDSSGWRTNIRCRRRQSSDVWVRVPCETTAGRPLMTETISSFLTYDVRFPTSRERDGSDAMNPFPDYSAAYLELGTSAGRTGYGLAFTVG